MPGGRPTTYAAEVASEICDWIAEGKSLAAWCRQSAVGYSTVTQWLNAHPEFAANYARAREAAGDADADLASDIRDRVLSGEIEPAVATVALNAVKWTAGIRQPKKYGPRTTLAGDADNPLETRSTTIIDVTTASTAFLQELAALAPPNPS